MLKRFSSLFSVLVITLMLMVSGCAGSATSNSSESATTAAGADGLTVKMLNVGQGDAILIQTKEQNVLVDTSDVDTRDMLLQELKKANVTHIDKMILSHPHADHIGGVEAVLNNLTVDEIYDNGMVSTSKLFTGYVKVAKEKKIARKALKEGDVLEFGNGATFKVFFPTEELVKTAKEGDKNGGYKHDPNNESIVGMLNYKNFNMLFTGDAEGNLEKKDKVGKVEAVVLKNHANELKAQVLKAPHHASRTSSDMDYLEKIQPKDVVISLGEGNSYGHPHVEAMERFKEIGAKTYQTNQLGTITIVTDGDRYTIKGEK